MILRKSLCDKLNQIKIHLYKTQKGLSRKYHSDPQASNLVGMFLNWKFYLKLNVLKQTAMLNVTIKVNEW